MKLPVTSQAWTELVMCLLEAVVQDVQGKKLTGNVPNFVAVVARNFRVWKF